MGQIIIGGKKIECEGEVSTWEETGMTFAGKANTIKRIGKPNLIIWHWTAGENPASGTYTTLITRRLGVEFCIDEDGVIWQFVDPLVHDPQDTSGKIGHRSISIEVANYGFAPKGALIPPKGRGRIVDDETIHGIKLRVARFWPDQLKAIENLTRALCDTIGIPKKFPREKDGSIALRLLTLAEQKTVTGIIGHFHKTTDKYDPGFHVFRTLAHLEE